MRVRLIPIGQWNWIGVEFHEPSSGSHQKGVEGRVPFPSGAGGVRYVVIHDSDVAQIFSGRQHNPPEFWHIMGFHFIDWIGSCHSHFNSLVQ